MGYQPNDRVDNRHLPEKEKKPLRINFQEFFTILAMAVVAGMFFGFSLFSTIHEHDALEPLDLYSDDRNEQLR